jgi:NAD+-processing family protein with receiver domain
MDDDEARGAIFLEQYPQALWVQTAEECISQLERRWDEVHLDHDLGGEHFVDIDREDCGMEVIRWLCLQPRPHLRFTRFFVHTHNPNARYVMLMHLQASGYQVEACPFGTRPVQPLPYLSPPPKRLRARFGDWLRRQFLRLQADSEVPSP